MGFILPAACYIMKAKLYQSYSKDNVWLIYCVSLWLTILFLTNVSFYCKGLCYMWLYTTWKGSFEWMECSRFSGWFYVFVEISPDCYNILLIALNLWEIWIGSVFSWTQHHLIDWLFNASSVKWGPFCPRVQCVKLLPFSTHNYFNTAAVNGTTHLLVFSFRLSRGSSHLCMANVTMTNIDNGIFFSSAVLLLTAKKSPYVKICTHAFIWIIAYLGDNLYSIM